LVVLSSASLAQANRVQGNAVIQEHQNNVNASTGKAWSPWQLEYFGLSCLELDALPWAGMPKNWPKAWKEAQKHATKHATEGNCKLCDVVFEGSKPEKMQSWTSSGVSTKVSCSALRLNDNNACFKPADGGPIKVYGLNEGHNTRTANPNEVCLPCPKGCKECHYDSWRDVKCVVPPTGTPETGERCVLPEGLTCGSCARRICSGLFNFGCNERDYEAACQFPRPYDNPKPQWDGPEDYRITMKGGKENKREFPLVLPYLQGTE